MSNKSPTATDRYIGERIKEFRKAAGMPQVGLGALVGISYNQVHKIEEGTNRVPAARLHELAKALDRPITDFFPPEDGR